MSKRLVTTGIIIVCLCVLSACTKGHKDDESDGKSATYVSAQKVFDFLVDAVSRKDSKAIKNKFSEYATAKFQKEMNYGK